MPPAAPQARTRHARGHSAGGDQMRRIAVGFDQDSFEQISREALTRGISFGERVRELVEIGHQTEQEEEAASCSTCSNSRSVSSSIMSSSKKQNQ